MGKIDSSASRMFLMRAVSGGIVQNPTRGIYVFSATRRIHPNTLHKIAQKLRSGLFVLEGIGVVEFTHTKKTMDTLAPNLFWDTEIEMFRVSPDYALGELKRVGRNLNMLN